MARRAGATALAVTTGTTGAAEWARQPPARRPHAVLGDLREVLGWVAGAAPAAAGARPGSSTSRARVARTRAVPARGRGRRSR